MRKKMKNTEGQIIASNILSFLFENVEQYPTSGGGEI